MVSCLGKTREAGEDLFKKRWWVSLRYSHPTSSKVHFLGRDSLCTKRGEYSPGKSPN
jgi:hypothetical protein